MNTNSIPRRLTRPDIPLFGGFSFSKPLVVEGKVGDGIKIPNDDGEAEVCGVAWILKVEWEDSGRVLD